MSKGDGTCPDCGKPTMYGRHLGLEKCEPSALLNMLTGPKELLYDGPDRRRVRIPGTTIIISRRKP